MWENMTVKGCKTQGSRRSEGGWTQGTGARVRRGRRRAREEGGGGGGAGDLGVGPNEHGPLAGLAPIALPQKRPLEAGVPEILTSLVLRFGQHKGVCLLYDADLRC